MPHPVLDRIMAHCTSSDYLGEVTRARTAYFSRTGPLDEERGDLETRMAAFLEWYLFEWSLGCGLTPVEHYTSAFAGEPDGEEARAALALCSSHHSLFSIKSIGDEAVHLDDLIGGGTWRVDERRRTSGLDVGDLMETRLLPLGQQVVFSPSCVFHPRQARAAIVDVVSQARAERRSRADLMLELGRMRLDAERYRHVAVERIYRLGGVLGQVGRALEPGAGRV
jgi:hypothetical protein